jgi:hypothetical protein
MDIGRSKSKSVRASVYNSLYFPVRDLVRDSSLGFVSGSIMDSLWISANNSLWALVWNSVEDSVTLKFNKWI